MVSKHIVSKQIVAKDMISTFVEICIKLITMFFRLYNLIHNLCYYNP